MRFYDLKEPPPHREPRANQPVLGNSASGPEIYLPGRISAGLYSGKPENRPTRIRPKSGLEARFPARKHYCVTCGTCFINRSEICGIGLGAFFPATREMPYTPIRLVAAALVPRPGPRHQGGTFNLERSGRGRPSTFQVWAPQKNLAGYAPGRTPPSSTLHSTGVSLRAPTARRPTVHDIGL